MAAKLSVGPAPHPEPSTSFWTVLASLGSNVVPLRRIAPSMAEQD